MRSLLSCELEYSSHIIGFSIWSFLLVNLMSENTISAESLNDDLLLPYLKRHGSRLHHRSIRSAQSAQFGNRTFEVCDAHSSVNMTPAVDSRVFVSDIRLNEWSYQSNHVYGHYTVLRNPARTFSVVEAHADGCRLRKLDTVQHAAVGRGCVVAQNGGFFDTKTRACLGNVVSDGRLVHDGAGVQNAHFGVTKSGQIVTGYLSEPDLATMDFTQLVGGVIWLVRNGSSYVEESIGLEEESTEETGSLRYFADVTSARTAIGHDVMGHVVFVQIDGQTGVRGAGLPAFARFLIDELHLVNAINLDGGGSATYVLNGSLASYPSDHCASDPMWRCDREVSTVICGHQARCEPGCERGTCENGRCVCDKNWRGESCDELHCNQHNCSRHGTCRPEGCECDAGWTGSDCDVTCGRDRFGPDCSQLCYCDHPVASCHPVHGTCDCPPGFRGKACDRGCELGRYGKNCELKCHCADKCGCDPVSGSCSLPPHVSDDLVNISLCVATRLFSYGEVSPLQQSSIYSARVLFFTSAGLVAFALLASLYVIVSRRHDDVITASSSSSCEEATKMSAGRMLGRARGYERLEGGGGSPVERVEMSELPSRDGL